MRENNTERVELCGEDFAAPDPVDSRNWRSSEKHPDDVVGQISSGG